MDSEMLIHQAINIIADSRRREARIVSAEFLSISSDEILCIDDVAVSGNTLSASRDAIKGPKRITGLVGMAWDSRRLRRNIEIPLLEVVRYRQVGGEKLPVNSLSTLASNADLRRDYSAKFFGNSTLLDAITEVYK
jgi:orotate phosphoribosyltransferase-like protein